ncbi:ABC transporter substrate-binding protein [Nocardioides sp.]|uniref:ABC transporter substrate-binding protein n=1 Tax=Nocardioides sp. TaxID=35761 RepID=UPI0035B2358D
MRKQVRGAALALTVAGLSLSAAACGGGDDSESGGDDKTITWWHNSNNEPGKGFYEQVAADFEDDNPGITVEVTAMAHEDMVDKLTAAFQSGDMPDVYMERGGGELAAHVDAGLTRDLTDDAADVIESIGGSVAGWQVDDRTYGLPFSLGVVGVWYNTADFEEAGVTPPTTMQEWEDANASLKEAGLTPLSLGAGDKWPAAHYWYYAAVRSCSEDVLTQATADLDFSDECFVQAGEVVQDFVETEPFNKGFLATPAQEGATSASGLLATGKVASELQGHWEPGVMQGLTDDGQGLGDKTGWFPFPAVEGGAGDPAAALGGGDAWAVSANAPDSAVDLVTYLLSEDVQRGFAENDMGLPTVPAATDAVSNPVLGDLIQVRDEAPYVQLYFDTAFGESIGGAMNDEIALLFAGKATPQDVVDAMQQAADEQG